MVAEIVVWVTVALLNGQATDGRVRATQAECQEVVEFARGNNDSEYVITDCVPLKIKVPQPTN